MQPIISVHHVSKQYRLGRVGTGSLSHDINRWWHRVRGKEDPYLKIGETNNRSIKGVSDYVWALRDINFEVHPGEVLGIIGRNGAGKSTLLKILSRITTPTIGSIKLAGRVASLLEVGTGMHPELTGRENIYLNGAILGMRRKEIDRKLDDIVDFAGVERYIDTPVKRYSSGMHVRLGFAVAAHLEPDILIVDEVLAVGDADFQKKCLGKMKDVSKEEGRTVLFVSHNMPSVKALCQKGILLKDGGIDYMGTAEETIRTYLGGNFGAVNFKKIGWGRNGFTLLELGIRNSGVNFEEAITREREIKLDFAYDNRTGYDGLYFNLKMKDEEGSYFLTTTSVADGFFIKEGKGTACMTIPEGFFNEGTYALDLMVIGKNEKGYETFFYEQDLLIVQILPEQRPLGSWMGRELGYIRHTFDWQT
jgi:lipopolysaccharide transport system ATP-binding protein